MSPVEWLVALGPVLVALGFVLSGGVRRRYLAVTLLAAPLVNMALALLFQWHPRPDAEFRPEPTGWIGFLVDTIWLVDLLWSVVFVWRMAAGYRISATILAVMAFGLALLTGFIAMNSVSGVWL
jgi:hypothetical protein